MSLTVQTNKAIVDSTLRPRCCPLVSHSEYTPY